MKKNDPFEEYDRAVLDRESRLEQEIDVEFDTLLHRDDTMKRFSRLGVELILHCSLDHGRYSTASAISVKQNVKDRSRAGIEGRKLFYELDIQVREAVTQRYTRRTVAELLEIGRTDSTERGKKEFYLRFLDQVNSLHFQTSLFVDSPDISPFLRSLSLPETPRERGRFERIIGKMKKRDYLSSGLSDKVKTYLYSPSPIPVQQQSLGRTSLSTAGFGDNPSASSNEGSSGGINDRSADQRTEVLSYLTDLFQLPVEIAERYAARVSLDELTDLHDKLDARVGQDYAPALVQVNPDILLYREQSRLSTYLKLLKQVQQRIRNNPVREELELQFGVGNNLRAYSTIEEIAELKERLYTATATIGQEEEREGTTDNFNLALYSFLHRNDPLVVSRLDSLVETGAVCVTEQEHWTEGITGPRSSHILKRIVFQMRRAYNALNLPEPRCSINHG
ncbi:hypothetical protein HYX12_04220, partial [Candidatus Woesearchaeota archaeon]|nr:hypothetical protein [Candidatus Woesearchaeota archaeon]